VQIRYFKSNASLSYVGTVQDGSILQNHQIHHRGNHHHQHDRTETHKTHPYDKEAMQKQRNHAQTTANKPTFDMEHSAEGERNKSYNQMTHQTLHVNAKSKRPTTKRTSKTALKAIAHNNPINECQNMKKGRQQKRRIPQPNFAASKQKNSFEWQYIFHKTFLPNQIDHNTTPFLNSGLVFILAGCWLR
jgi:hypothetical protein